MCYAFSVGAPSKLDDLRAKRICDAVKRGLPRDTAARLAGVTPSTLFLWLRKGRAGDADYSEFSQRVRAAEAEGEAALVAMMTDDHAPNSWQACAWLLERRHPKRWAAKKGIEAAASSSAKAIESTSREQQLAVLASLKAALESAA